MTLLESTYTAYILVVVLFGVGVLARGALTKKWPVSAYYKFVIAYWVPTSTLSAVRGVHAIMEANWWGAFGRLAMAVVGVALVLLGVKTNRRDLAVHADEQDPFPECPRSGHFTDKPHMELFLVEWQVAERRTKRDTTFYLIDITSCHGHHLDEHGSSTGFYAADVQFAFEVPTVFADKYDRLFQPMDGLLFMFHEHGQPVTKVRKTCWPILRANLPWHPTKETFA